MENNEVMMDMMDAAEEMAEVRFKDQIFIVGTLGLLGMGIYVAGKFIGKKVIMPMIEPKIREIMQKRRDKREEAERIKHAKEVEVVNDEE